MKVALGVTGCIAAYKAIEVLRGLQKAGVSVQAVLTRAALNFVTPLTFESISGHKVLTDLFVPGENLEIQHIRVAQEIQLLAVVPATANILGKFAHGIADDFLSTLYISTPAPVVLAPAMNVEMWNHPAVRRNVEILKMRGHEFVNPEEGELACGMEGEGRLAEVGSITSAVLDMLVAGGSLSGLKVLVTAGPTIEDLDPVRFISNRSSGKMGYAVAQAARRRSAEVVLVSGPTHLPPPIGVRLVEVRSADDMRAAVLEESAHADIVVMAAAVADYKPMQCLPHKLKKKNESITLSLEPTEDILDSLGKAKKNQVLVGFAAETEDVISNARKKLSRKSLDLIVANDVSSGVFAEDRSTAHIITASGEQVTLADQSKLTIANQILDLAQVIVQTRRDQRVPG